MVGKEKMADVNLLMRANATVKRLARRFSRCEVNPTAERHPKASPTANAGLELKSTNNSGKTSTSSLPTPISVTLAKDLYGTGVEARPIGDGA